MYTRPPPEEGFSYLGSVTWDCSLRLPLLRSGSVSTNATRKFAACRLKLREALWTRPRHKYASFGEGKGCDACLEFEGMKRHSGLRSA